MLHEEKKVAKIVEELTMYLFAVGADKIQSGIEKEGQYAIITLKANYSPEYRESFRLLEDSLNCPKNDGIEDVYWELAGTGEPGETNQLLLIGMMIDSAKVRVEEDFIYMRLSKELLE